MSDDTLELMVGYGIIVPLCLVITLGCLPVCKWILKEIMG